MVVTPDWITQCILEKSLVNAEGYHPSLLIDPSKEKSPVQPPIEPLKNVKLSEKKEEVKPRIVEETKPIEVKAAEIKTVPETPAVVQQPAPQEVVNHAPTTITAPPSTKNMRIASNLPPHIEQQLQQHFNVEEYDNTKVSELIQGLERYDLDRELHEEELSSNTKRNFNDLWPVP